MPKMRLPRNPRDRRPKLVRPSKEERDQAGELEGRHPWNLTYGEFLRRVASDYGLQQLLTEVRDTRGRLVTIRYFKSLDGNSVVPLPGKLRMDEVLDEPVTAGLCRGLGIPPEDFGLDPEPDE